MAYVWVRAPCGSGYRGYGPHLSMVHILLWDALRVLLWGPSMGHSSPVGLSPPMGLTMDQILLWVPLWITALLWVTLWILISL